MRGSGCSTASRWSLMGRTGSSTTASRSSANLVVPITLAVASTLRSAFPTTRRAVGPAAAFLARAIQRLPCRFCPLSPQARRGQFDRLVDLDVAGTAAEVARQGLLDVVSVGARVVCE